MLGGREGPQKDPGVLGLSPLSSTPSFDQFGGWRGGMEAGPWVLPRPFCFLPPSHRPPPWPCLPLDLSPLCVVLSSSPFSLHLGASPHPQQSLKAESRPLEGSPARLPILADMLLYYCRFAARPVLLQVYQTEVRLVLPLQTGCRVPLRPSPAALCCGGVPGSPSGKSTLMPALLPTAADLRHRGEDDRDLHPLPGAGSLRCHTCHQGFRWVLPEPLWRWAGTQGPLGEEGSQGTGAGGTRKGQGGRAPGL